MGYESELNDLFVDDELFSYAINDLTNQHEINSSIRLGSILNRIKIDYGLQGIRQTVSFINKISATKVTFNDLRKTMKFFEYISKGMRISYKITMGANPQTANSMKILQYIFPLMIVWWGRSFPAGLTLYWFFGTLYMCVQQKFVLAKIKKDREKKAAQKKYEEEHPELFVKEEPVEEPLVPEDDVDVYEDFESYDDYSDFYTEEELEKMNKEKLQREKNNKKKKK